MGIMARRRGDRIGGGGGVEKERDEKEGILGHIINFHDLEVYISDGVAELNGFQGDFYGAIASLQMVAITKMEHFTYQITYYLFGSWNYRQVSKWTSLR